MWLFSLHCNVKHLIFTFQMSYGSEMTQQSGIGVDDSSNDALVIVDDPLMGGSTQGLYIKKTTVILYLSTLVFYFKKLWSLCNNYVSPHFGGETYCFFPVRLSVTQFVSATPLKLLNRISWSLVGSKDTIFSCAYYQEIFDLLNFVGVMPLWT